VESGDFGFNLMKYWQISPVFTHEVGLLIKFHVLTDSATWNPGVQYLEIGAYDTQMQKMSGVVWLVPDVLEIILIL